MICRASALVSMAALVAVAGRAGAATGEWARSTGGTWWNSTNWEGEVPFAPDDEALFFDTIPTADTIMIDGPASVGTLYLSNTSPLMFGGSNTLTLASNTADAFVGVETGSHTVSAPLHVASHSVLHVLEPSVLTIAGPMSTGAGVEFAKVSSGALEIRGPQAHGEGSLFIAIEGLTTVATDAGSAGAADLAVNVENTAVVHFGASQHLRELKVGGGFQGEDVAPVVVVEAGGGRVLHTQSLAIDPTGTLDVADNALVVQATAATRGAVLAEVEAWTAAGRDGAAGLWLGKGITSSVARARPLTGLAVVMNDRGDGTPVVTAVQGEPVDMNSIIVQHTFNGDANLDGVIDADDYFRIDGGFLAQPANPAYNEGDFNYDDTINADDYFLIDAAFLGQGGVAAAGGGVLQSVVVPEPGSAALLAAGGLLLMRRRGRSGCR